MLGIAALGVLTDTRWTAARLMLQVQVFMLTLILVAAARAHDEFDTSNVMTWLLLGGFVTAAASAAALSITMDARARSQVGDYRHDSDG
jgi:pheromone shutdown protein TraB